MTRTHLTSLSILLFAYACGGSPDDNAGAAPAPAPANEDETGNESQSSTSTSTSSGDDEEEPADTTPAAGGAPSDAPSDAPSEAGAGGEAGASSTEAPPVVEPACGDGIVDEGESCDDGNDVTGDGCNADCVPSGHSTRMTVVAMEHEQELFGLALSGDTLYAVGKSREGAPGTTLDRLIASVDMSADTLFATTKLDGVPGKNEWLAGVATDGAYLYTAGTASPGANIDGVVERRTLFGDETWTRTFAGSSGLNDWMVGVALTGTGLHAVGHQYNTGSNADIVFSLLSKTDSNTPSTAQDATAYNDYGRAIAKLGDGSVVTGKLGAAGGSKVFLRGLDAGAGILWTRTLEISADPFAVATGSDGRIVVAGSFYNDDEDVWFATFDSEGNIQFPKTIERVGEDRINGVVIEPETNDIIVTGTTANPDNGSQDFFIERFTWDRVSRWRKTFDPHEGHDAGYAITLDSNGQIWAVGSLGTDTDDLDCWIGQFAP